MSPARVFLRAVSVVFLLATSLAVLLLRVVSLVFLLSTSLRSSSCVLAPLYSYFPPPCGPPACCLRCIPTFHLPAVLLLRAVSVVFLLSTSLRSSSCVLSPLYSYLPPPCGPPPACCLRCIPTFHLPAVLLLLAGSVVFLLSTSLRSSSCLLAPLYSYFPPPCGPPPACWLRCIHTFHLPAVLLLRAVSVVFLLPTSLRSSSCLSSASRGSAASDTIFCLPRLGCQ